MESEGSNQNLSAAEQTLQHMEYVVMTLVQISSQMSEFRAFKASLTRIEKALKTMQSESLSDACQGSCRSHDVMRKQRSNSNSSSGLMSAKLEGDMGGHRDAPSPSAGALYGMLTQLEEARAQELCGRGKRRRKRSVSFVEPEEGPSPCPSVPSVGSRRSRPDMPGLHQPSSHESASAPADSPKKLQLTADFSGVSVDEPAQPSRPSAAPTPSVPSSLPILGRRRSLDNLRADHDAIIAAPSLASPCSKRISAGMPAALPSTGWFLLSLVGILDFRCGRKWRYLSRASLGMQMLGMGALLAMIGTWHEHTTEQSEPLVTSVLYLIGALVGIMSLRRNKITSLLGPAEYLLEDYADECDFLEDWRKLSSVRLLQIAGFFAFMLGCRLGAMFLTPKAVYGKLAEVVCEFEVAKLVAFTGMALCYCTACYCVFHITAGLELAVDSFAVRCFSTGDMEAALMSWNVVQATLRQVSCKLSDFLILLASSCMAAVIMFAYQVVSLTLSEERESVLDVLMWMGWVYSPVLLFLYVLSSAAAVTEKVDRLVPLVNSWSFDDRAVLDESRQYVVQYILQSRAGFYLRGIRFTASNVQKLSYYFAAGSFGFLAKLWN